MDMKLCEEVIPMSVTKKPFGVTAAGEQVSEYRITNASGAYVTIIDYGATITGLCVPDQNGKLVDVLLGCDKIAAYENTRLVSIFICNKRTRL